MVTRRTRHIAGIVAAVLVAVASGLFGFGAVLVAIRPAPAGYPTDRPIGAVLAALCLGIVVGCMSVAVRLWRRARRGSAEPQTATERRGAIMITTARRRRRPVSGIVVASIGLLLFGGASALAVASAVQEHSSGRLSGYVQQHGIRALATVTSVRYVLVYDWTESSHYGSDVNVSLSPGIAGTRTSVVYDAHEVAIAPGTLIRILVDPERPAYAEFPGQPYAGVGTWIGSVAAAALILLPALVFAVAIVSLIRGRSHWDPLRHFRPRSPRRWR